MSCQRGLHDCGPGRCRACVHDWHMARRAARLAYFKARHAAHRAEDLDGFRVYHVAHRDKVLAEHRRRYWLDHDARLAKQHKRDVANREQHRAYMRAYHRRGSADWWQEQMACA